MNMYYNQTLRQIPLKEHNFQSEAAMQFFLLDNTDLLCPEELGFEDISSVEYEVAVRNEERAGRMDITAIYDGTTIGIIELKNVELTIAHLNQLTNYFTLTDRLAQKFKDLAIDSMERFGLLIGPSISRELEDRIRQGDNLKDGTISAMILQRFRDEENNCYIFNRVISANPGRDFTRYLLDGVYYGKARYVQAVLRKFIESNQHLTLAQLQKKFPREIQGNLEMVLNKKSPKATKKNYFVNANDLIPLEQGIEVVITRQWGKSNIDRFLNLIPDLGLDT